MELKPLNNSIVFTFVQTVREGYFRNETDWGFKMAGNDYDSSKARWGLAEMVGPDVKYVSPGDYILIEPLKWTTAVEVDENKYWRTCEDFVMGTSTEKPTDII